MPQFEMQPSSQSQQGDRIAPPEESFVVCATTGRVWAYFLLAACCLVLVGVAVLPVALSRAAASTTLAPDDSSQAPVLGNATSLQSGNVTACDRVDSKPDGSKVCTSAVRAWTLPCVGYIIVAGIAGFFALALIVPCMLAAVGFGVIGVAAGSIAACFQGACGTPPCFRCMQSTAMLGVPLPVRGWMGAVGFVAGCVAGAYWLPMCFTDQETPINVSG
ncbi:uncharacterized protein LOC117648236 isoform X1 [Thrips palmi]|uniref:Uncharacterized protein LOC117648236 isoform X1 n=1 Tax=Thrips palmi TaxID=161013 RepID=A0A6P8Z7Y7_THRPL|nr:uncharacterized protein LOC117648236 isoform X1 [Thrips palmi]